MKRKKKDNTVSVQLDTGSEPARLEVKRGICIGNKTFSALLAILVTALVFSVYVGQIINMHFVCFAYGLGDKFTTNFPVFRQAWKLYLRNGIDIGVVNGAAEIALRVNVPFQNPFFILFSALGRLIGFELAYIMFHAAHMAVFIYFGTLLMLDVFHVDRKYACLFSLTALSVLFSASHCLGFYVAAALTTPMLYCSFKLLKRFNIGRCILTSLPYVCCFFCGYITIGVFGCGVVLLLTVLYGFTWEDDNGARIGVKRVLFRAAAPFAIACGVSVLCLLQMVNYVNNIVCATQTYNYLAYTTSLPHVPKDWTAILSNAFYPLSSTEFNYWPHLGWPLCAILGLTVIYNCQKEMVSGRKKILIYSIMAGFVVFLLIAAGTNSAFAYWFYAVPIVGMMHSSVRFFAVVMPCTFLAVTLLLYHNQQLKPGVKKAVWILAGLTGIAIAWLLFKRSSFASVDENALVVELCILLACLVLYAKNGVTWMTVIMIVFGASMFPMVHWFYVQGTLVDKPTYEATSIVYSDEAMERLDDYIDGLPERERYRFVTLDMAQESALPVYVPNNLALYMDTEHTLSEYSGIDLHLQVPRDYVIRFPWFDVLDWDYMADTRCDFIVVSPAMFEAHSEQMWKIIDPDAPTLPLADGSVVYQTRKFIPSHYVGESYVEDQENTLDNGYFYCPYLTQDDLLSFETNKASRFAASIHADEACEVAFTLYPNCYYHYYVDGEEIEPIIDDLQVFIPIPAGEHQIEVVYKNTVNTISNCIFYLYYAVVLVTSVTVFAMEMRKRKARKHS